MASSISKGASQVVYTGPCLRDRDLDNDCSSVSQFLEPKMEMMTDSSEDDLDNGTADEASLIANEWPQLDLLLVPKVEMVSEDEEDIGSMRCVETHFEDTALNEDPCSDLQKWGNGATVVKAEPDFGSEVDGNWLKPDCELGPGQQLHVPRLNGSEVFYFSCQACGESIAAKFCLLHASSCPVSNSENFQRPDSPIHADPRCPICSYRPRMFKNYLEHLRTMHGINKNGGPIIPDSDNPVIHDSVEELNIPSDRGQLDSSDERLNCDFVDKQVGLLDQRKHTRTLERPYSCSVCSRTYCDRKNLIRHAKTHESGNHQMFACRLCSYTSLRKHCINAHVKRVHASAAGEGRGRPRSPAEPLLKCHLCSYESDIRRDINRHIRQKHGQGVRTYACNICEYIGKDSDSLKRHLRVHTGEKPYLCPGCGSAFGSNSTLNRHQREHCNKPRKERGFPCPECSLQFKARQRLRQHLKRVHAVVEIATVDQVHADPR